jgi:hypothetical protein
MAGPLCGFCGGAVVRLLPESARAKTAMAEMVANQTISRGTFDIFMFYSFSSCAPAFPDLPVSTKTQLKSAIQRPDIAQPLVIKASKKCLTESNRTVTSADLADHLLPCFFPRLPH